MGIGCFRVCRVSYLPPLQQAIRAKVDVDITDKVENIATEQVPEFPAAPLPAENPQLKSNLRLSALLT